MSLHQLQHRRNLRILLGQISSVAGNLNLLASTTIGGSTLKSNSFFPLDQVIPRFLALRHEVLCFATTLFHQQHSLFLGCFCSLSQSFIKAECCALYFSSLKYFPLIYFCFTSLDVLFFVVAYVQTLFFPPSSYLFTTLCGRRPEFFSPTLFDPLSFALFFTQQHYL